MMDDGCYQEEVSRGLQIGEKDCINLKRGIGIMENKEEHEHTRDEWSERYAVCKNTRG
jgi:hypothetical protein